MSRCNAKKDDNTIYDSVFKTMVHKMPKLVVLFVNEVFGRDYLPDSAIIQFNNEHEGPRGTNIDDSVFRLQDKIYHLECQSTPDTAMVVRMIEYDFSIALEHALATGAPYRIEFPASCVLYLRHTPAMPDILSMDVVLPDGQSFEYQAKVFKAQLVTSGEIFQKRLLMLLLYYLMRYERQFEAIAHGDALTAKLVSECVDLHAQLESLTLRENELPLYEELDALIIRVSDYLLRSYDAFQEKVRSAMGGGKVLELVSERMERLEREAQEARDNKPQRNRQGDV